MNSIRDDPNGIQIVAYSGGVQSFNTAVESGSMGNVTSQPLSAIDVLPICLQVWARLAPVLN